MSAANAISTAPTATPSIAKIGAKCIYSLLNFAEAAQHRVARFLCRLGMVAILIGHGKIMGRAVIDGDFRIGMAGIGGFDLRHFLHGDDGVFVAEMEADRTGNLAGFIQGLADLGTVEGARRIDASLRALHDGLFLESNPIPVKWAVARMGLMGEGIRLPLTPLASQYHDAVRQAMEEANSVVAAA